MARRGQGGDRRSTAGWEAGLASRESHREEGKQADLRLKWEDFWITVPAERKMTRKSRSRSHLSELFSKLGWSRGLRASALSLLALALSLQAMACDSKRQGAKKDAAKSEDSSSEEEEQDSESSGTEDSEDSDESEESKESGEKGPKDNEDKESDEESTSESESEDESSKSKDSDDKSSEEDSSTESKDSESSSDTSESSSSDNNTSTGGSNGRDCDKISWGSGMKTGSIIQRTETTGYLDTNGDGKLEETPTKVGTCQLHLTGKKCGLVFYGWNP